MNTAKEPEQHKWYLLAGTDLIHEDEITSFEGYPPYDEGNFTVHYYPKDIDEDEVYRCLYADGLIGDPYITPKTKAAIEEATCNEA